jgi:hypothetical protein
MSTIQDHTMSVHTKEMPHIYSLEGKYIDEVVSIMKHKNYCQMFVNVHGHECFVNVLMQ